MRKVYLALVSAYLMGAWAVLPASPAKAATEARPQPVLGEFIQIVVQGHPALEAAQAALDAARARARGQGRPLYNPELEVDYEDAEVRTKQVGLAQTFDWSGKRSARADVAQAEVTAAEATYDIARKSLLTELLTGLAEHQARLDVFQLSKRRVELNYDFLGLAERRNRAGDLPKTQLLTARLALAEAKVNRTTAQGDLAGARENLVAIVGEKRSLWPRMEGVPSQNPPPPDVARLEKLPELRFARSQAQTFRSRIQVARKNRVPDPTLGVRYGEEGATSLLGLRLSIPLPIRNSFRAEVDAARADVIVAEQSYSDIYRRAEARLGTSHERYLAVAAAWKDWREGGAEPLEEQRLLLQRLWQAGEINAVDYLVQLNQTFATEIASSELRGRLWSAWFNWLDASGAVDEWVENIQ